jgi:hypothetical protein
MELFFHFHKYRLEEIAERDENEWCEYNTWRNTSDKERFKAKNCEGTRYRALTWQNAKTVELRIFNATCRLPTFIKNVEFAHAFYQYTKSASLDEVERGDFSDFEKFLTDRKTVYPELCSFLAL